MSSRNRLLAVGCAIVGAAYLVRAIYRGLTFMVGDYYFTLSGEYIQRLNPTLWNSPDLQASIAYNHGTYLYGPMQYLLLYPVVFLSSYRAIALSLLAVYPVVLIGAWYGMNALVASGERANTLMTALLFAVSFAFLPLTEALIQREFEVVAFLLIVLACVAFVRGRDAASGALLAGAAWFRTWPIVLLGSFVFHRRVRALAAFAAATAAILLAAQLVFGLQHFVIGKTLTTVSGVFRPLGGGEVLFPVIARGAQKSDFCRQWIGGRGTQADVRWMLCSVEDRTPILNAKAIFYGLVIATGGLFLWGLARLWRAQRPDGSAPKWGLIWEFAVLLIAGATFVHAHYYYYIVLLLPLCALLYAYVREPQAWRKTKLTLWAIAYILLNSLMLPISWLSSMVEANGSAWYLDSGLCLLGVLLLLGLVLWEFTHTALGAPAAFSTV